MKAYKVVNKINGKLYSYITSPMFLTMDLSRGMAVQYELNKKTTYKRNGDGNKFLYCLSELTKESVNFVILTDKIKIFECIATKSNSRDAIHYENKLLKPNSVFVASTITLIREIPRNEWIHLL